MTPRAVPVMAIQEMIVGACEKKEEKENGNVLLVG
jgi:hypothetical protein